MVYIDGTPTDVSTSGWLPDELQSLTLFIGFTFPLLIFSRYYWQFRGAQDLHDCWDCTEQQRQMNGQSEYVAAWHACYVMVVELIYTEGSPSHHNKCLQWPYSCIRSRAVFALYDIACKAMMSNTKNFTLTTTSLCARPSTLSQTPPRPFWKVSSCLSSF